MKKLLIILVIAMILPVAAFADMPDYIVGNWYVVQDYVKYPELGSINPGCDYVITVYTFRSDGVILCTENFISGDTGSPKFNPAGKWERTGDNLYKYSLIGLGEGTAKLEKSNCLLISVQDMPNTYLRMNKMYSMNPYSDYVVR